VAIKQIRGKNLQTKIKHASYLLVGWENIHGPVVGNFMKSLQTITPHKQLS
jgi:hypothetical protein